MLYCLRVRRNIWGIAQLEECLMTMHKFLSLTPAQIKLSWCCISASSALVGQRQGDQQSNIILGFTVSSRAAWAICKTMYEKQISRRNIFSKNTIYTLRDTWIEKMIQEIIQYSTMYIGIHVLKEYNIIIDSL